MNNKQKLFEAITGYSPTLINVGARNDFYFDECKTKDEKIQQLKDYAENALEIYLTENDIESVYDAIETEKDGANDWFYVYNKLKKHGSVVVDNEKYLLTQDVYIDGTDEDPYYTALAVKEWDYEENLYEIIWEIQYEDDGSMPENEDEMCDWDNPAKIISLNGS